MCIYVKSRKVFEKFLPKDENRFKIGFNNWRTRSKELFQREEKNISIRKNRWYDISERDISAPTLPRRHFRARHFRARHLRAPTFPRTAISAQDEFFLCSIYD
jgi:hypothetical protein